MNRFLSPAAFLAGLAALAWVAAGYLGSNLLALAMTLLIAAFYLMGALELRGYHAATAALARSLAAPAATPPILADWLATVPAALRNPVRLRFEGERVGLPGPALTPYLVGLLVILGMLGTFLGMVVTLKGAVVALESSTDLLAVRSALAAPIQGLGLAFGTSIAGVCASAMLGLMSALCRRERLRAGQALDTRLAGDLRPCTRAHRDALDRDATREALQVPARVMPAMLDRLQALAATLERQGEARDAQSHANQEGFHRQARAAYETLADSVGKSLQASLADSARIAGATLQPVVETTMAGIARETSALHGQVAATVQAHLDGLAARFDASVTTVADRWTTALARHEHANAALDAGLQRSLGQFNADFERRAGDLVTTVDAAHGRWQAALSGALAETTRGATALHETVAASARAQMADLGLRLQGTVDTVATTWRDALAHHRDTSRQLTDASRASLEGAAAGFEQRAGALLASVDAAHGTLRTDLAARDDARLAAWTGGLADLAATLRAEWQQAGALVQDQHAQVGRTLAATADAIGTQAAEQARATVAEIAQLMQAAAQAPRAAAEVIEALRGQVSAGLARDTDLLAERARIMTTLGSLLEAVNLAATEQRSAISGLVTTASDLLERAGARHAAQVEAETGQLAATAAQLTDSAVEVASMGEAFGAAVQQFGASNEGLVAQLQRIEAALAKSTARSDDQLAYYVAQAREIIDLSLSAQKQIVDDLQRLAAREVQPA